MTSSKTYQLTTKHIIALALVFIVGIIIGIGLSQLITYQASTLTHTTMHVTETTTTTKTVLETTTTTFTSTIKQATTTTKTKPTYTTQTTTTSTQTTSAGGIVVVDFRGKTIRLKEPAKRIVVLSSYWAEILVALGAKDRIVGIGSYVVYDEYLPSNVRNKTVVGSVFKGVNIEEVISLNPDLVIMDYGYGKANEIIEQLEGLGIPVIGLFMKSFDDELKAIELLGKVVGAEDRAKELIDFMYKRYTTLKERANSIPKDKRLRVVVVSGTSILKGGSLSVYANTSWGKTVEDVGAINIALKEHPNEKWVKIDIETLVKWNPDVILIASSVPKIHDVLDKILEDPLWRSLRAYSEGKIYVIPCWSKIGGVLDWGPRDIIGREYIASILYPEVYSDIDWRKDMEELLKKYYGLFIPAQAFAVYSLEWKEVVDMTGEKVKIPRRVNRIVDLITYETMIAFKAMDKLVGVSKYAFKNPLVKTAYPNISSIPSPGSSFSLNIEEVAALNPDIVLIWPYKPKIVEELKNIGIPVVGVQLYSYNDIKRLLWLLGVILDKQDRAKELIEDMDYIVGLIRERVENISSDKRVKVLYLWSKPTKVQGGKGTVNDFIVLAGGLNVAAKELVNKTYVIVDLEKIIEWNPDIIIIWYYAKYNETTILNDPAWASINAVKNKRVYREPYYEHWNMDATLFILWLAKKMYPELFSDVDFVEMANKYYEKWYGVSYSQVLVEAGG